MIDIFKFAINSAQNKNINCGQFKRIGKTTYIREKIKKTREKFPNIDIAVLVPGVTIGNGCYLDLIKDGYLDFIIPISNIDHLRGRSKDILIFADNMPNAEELLNNIGLKDSFVFGLYNSTHRIIQNKQLVVIMGLAGSGKSSYVDKYFKNSHQIVCADNIRKALGHVFDIKIEPLVHAMNETLCRAHMERSCNIVIDETNTTNGSLMKWVRLANEYNYNKKLIVINTHPDECKKRRGCFEGKFPEHVIDRMRINMEIVFDFAELNTIFDEIQIIGEPIKQWKNKK